MNTKSTHIYVWSIWEYWMNDEIMHKRRRKKNEMRIVGMSLKKNLGAEARRLFFDLKTAELNNLRAQSSRFIVLPLWSDWPIVKHLLIFLKFECWIRSTRWLNKSGVSYFFFSANLKNFTLKSSVLHDPTVPSGAW